MLFHAVVAKLEALPEEGMQGQLVRDVRMIYLLRDGFVAEIYV